MKKTKAEIELTLDTLAGGAFAEKFNEALVQVAENIQDPNTEPTAKRGITITLKFAPNKQRNVVNTSIAVTTKLAATESIDTQVLMGKNIRTGKLEIAEYDGQVKGQMSFSDVEEGTPEPTTKEEQIAQLAASGLVAGRDFDPDTGEVYDTKEKTDSRVIPIRKMI